MAELLKREYDLIVLKVELGAGSVGTESDFNDVRMSLQEKVDGELVDKQAWKENILEIAPEEGITSRTSIGRGPRFCLPESTLNRLRKAFKNQDHFGKPLWVHLVKPYGVLRLVPWERILGDALGVPILMLPDFIFPPPREQTFHLDVVICGSAPLGYETGSIQNEIHLIIDKVRNIGGRKVKLHVFTDQDIAASLLGVWGTDPRLGDSLLIHSLATTGSEWPSPEDGKNDVLQSPWLIWIRKAMKNRCVDVVHFVCHGFYSQGKGALLFAQSPETRSEAFMDAPVGSRQLGTFLTQVGAWSTVFTSPDDNHSEPGLRMLADEIAQTRPGPMMMYSRYMDGQAETLEASYNFLYSSEPGDIPLSQALFIYCQPYRTFKSMPESDRSRLREMFSEQAKPAPVPLKLGAALSEIIGRILPERFLPDLLASKTAEAVRQALATPEAADLAKSIQVVFRTPMQKKALSKTLVESPLDGKFGQTAVVNTIVASTERFVEQVQLRYQQLARDHALETASSKKEMEAVFDTMQRLRQAVASRDVERPRYQEGA